MSVNALGYCEDAFDPSDPGRLCRGRERWIESYPDETQESIHRVVISGAAFSDDSAGDARRGLCYSGSSAAELILMLHGNQKLTAWAEEADPARIPAAATAVETYTITHPGGPLRRWAARWTMDCATAEDIQAALEAGADVFVVRTGEEEDPRPLGPAFDPAFAPVPPLADATPRSESSLGEGLRQQLYLLSGLRQGSGRRFQAAMLPELLKHVSSVILIHSDKHGRCVGIYSLSEQTVSEQLHALSTGREMLVVPFAIPPMLARWDRALWELRQTWDVEVRGPFPVPEAPDGVQSWGRRQSNRMDG
ncbi:MAG: hypothetical protein ACI8RZ_005008 [Myxococcota bacterium]|jgi:hypothetical protein